MRSVMMPVGLAVASLLSTVAVDTGRAAQPGRLYAFHSSPVGGCPAMDWHIVVEPDRSLNGFVAWDHMKHVATVSGSVETGRVFQMTAAETGGTGKTATIKGQVEDSFIVASIDGTKTGCDKQQISVPYFAAGLAGGGG